MTRQFIGFDRNRLRISIRKYPHFDKIVVSSFLHFFPCWTPWVADPFSGPGMVEGVLEWVCSCVAVVDKKWAAKVHDHPETSFLLIQIAEIPKNWIELGHPFIEGSSQPKDPEIPSNQLQMFFISNQEHSSCKEPSLAIVKQRANLVVWVPG